MRLLVNYDDKTFRQLRREGKKNNLVIYRQCGVALARQFPAHVNRSAKTIEASRIFGIAVSRSKTFRQLLAPLFHFPKKKMHLNFNTRLKQCFFTSDHGLLSIKADRLKHFSFNDAAQVRRHWSVALSCNQQENHTEISIPSFVPQHSFKAPPGTVSIECTFAAACVRMDDGKAVGHHHISIQIPFDDSIQVPHVVSLPISTYEGCLVIVGASLTYLLSHNKKEMRTEFLPSSVIDAWFIKTKAQGTIVIAT
jgi:hypothetical protein